MIKKLWQGIYGLWCDFVHRDGQIVRDENGLMNWRCRRCGRWAFPLAGEIERDRRG